MTSGAREIIEDTRISWTSAALLPERGTLDEEELKVLATHERGHRRRQTAARRRVHLLRRSPQRARGEQCLGRRLHVRVAHQRLSD